MRLTAEDGYQAQRSYSIASGPEDEHLVLTVERLEDGEVSPYLVDELRPGDELELRGPIGGYFVWEESLGGPLLLVAGGSGVVPLRSMLRHRAATHSTIPARLLYSARSLPEVIYRDEFARLAARQRSTSISRSPVSGRTTGQASGAGSTRSSSRKLPGRRRSGRSSTSAGRPPSSRQPRAASSRSATTPD